MSKEETAAEQRQRMMSRDERAIQARDVIAKNLHEQNMRDGKQSTYEKAHRKAQEIANREHRKNSR